MRTQRARRAITASALLLSLALVGDIGATQRSEALAIAAEQRQERIDVAVAAGQAEQEFIDHARSEVARAEQEQWASELDDQRQDVTEQVEALAALVEELDGQVLDEAVLDEWAEQAGDLADEVPGASAVRLRAIAEEASQLTEEAHQSHQDWQEEQERIAAERRAAEEARRQAAATTATTTGTSTSAGASSNHSASAASTSSSGSNSTSSSNTSGGSSGGSSSSNASATPSAGSAGGGGGGGMDAQARAVLARHGCGSVPITWDSPRMSAGANGNADWLNGTILLRSTMPQWRLAFVAAHECAHFLQWWAYGGDWQALQEDMNAIYGGSGYAGLEQNADCITQRWGYSAHNYTTSCGGDRGAAAAAIANGNRP